MTQNDHLAQVQQQIDAMDAIFMKYENVQFEL